MLTHYKTWQVIFYSVAYLMVLLSLVRLVLLYLLSFLFSKLFLESAKKLATRFTAWITHVAAYHSIDLSRWEQVELKGTEPWSDVPNMLECFACKEATPSTGDKDTA